MRDSPGEYYDIGKMARDLLHKGYAYRPCAPSHFDSRRLKSNIDISCKVKDIVPGLSTAFSFSVPNSVKVELQYLNGIAGIAGSIGMTRNDDNTMIDPIATFSGVIGRGAFFSVGADLVFDICTRTFNKLSAGLSLNTSFVNASLSMDRLDTFKASCHYIVNPEKTAIAAELKHTLSIDDTTLAIGAQHAFFASTLAKGRISTDGKVAALIQQGLWQRIFLSVSGEMDFTDTQPHVTPKIGLSLAIVL